MARPSGYRDGFGATYIALAGLVILAGDLTENDVTLNEIGFTQFEAVQTDRVPAAVGYANNEPYASPDSGAEVSTIKVSDHINLVSNGIVTSESYMQQNPDVVRRFIRATMRGLHDTFANPDEAFPIVTSIHPRTRRRPATISAPGARRDHPLLEASRWRRNQSRHH